MKSSDGWIRLAVVSLMAATLGCQEAQQAASVPAGKAEVSLALNWFADAQHGGFFAAQEQGLFALASSIESTVDEIPSVGLVLRLDEFPVDPEVGQRSVRMVLILEAAVPFLILDRVAFGPSETFIQVIAIKPLKSHEAYARVDQYVVYLRRSNDDLILSGNELG